MQKYIIGLVTGIFFTASFFILVAAKSMADHTHDADEINYSEYSYGGWGTLQKKIEDMDDEIESIADHTHDADEINYSEYSYSGWGTLQKKIEDLDDDKADEDHTH